MNGSIGAVRLPLRWSLWTVVVAVLALAAVSSGVAQPAPEGPSRYVVKFVCGTGSEIVAPGTYFTAINVHNPTKGAISLQKRFALALPGERPGPVTNAFDAKLDADQAFEIDCPDIRRRSRFSQRFLKGFAIIESRGELDVVAVYTAAGATKMVETLHMERVPARREAR